ncbi:YbaB/EbfC family nucleoid-associated protein [Amycolatopsis sp. SID8362]|uniref:YbaB/EbfC family nucleoid-associated protein n=1 Tax=Amycolatopsis sp. SID8362 TaxID=2690346 RepID=UPI00136E8FF9|nr:YbaB/EbfC family nucleoid-associated protein [Amycolatopsis sp. SID8362]NBH06436.1 YbaB/EbfC family DNA-binding protein [Amycolatopsis sp. SID8362]NED43134.1 YbaB/EbfC family nucleoid-associated protein [Amycolatopsis sp. SID8362]
MKDQMDTLLENFERQTAQLRDAQAAAAETTAQVSSPDGLVRATIDAGGSLAKLEFAPATFERTTPAQLANTVQTLVRQGSLQVKQKIADLMAPITEGLPDLADLVEGAPSLAGLVPRIPEFVEEEAPAPRPESFEEGGSILRNEQAPPPMPAPKPAPKRVRPPRDDDEEPPSSWMTRGD